MKNSKLFIRLLVAENRRLNRKLTRCNTELMARRTQEENTIKHLQDQLVAAGNENERRKKDAEELTATVGRQQEEIERLRDKLTGEAIERLVP